MKKKFFIIVFTMIFLLSMVLLTTGCNKVKVDKNYDLYTYEPVQGAFVKNTAKYVFDKKTYTLYGNDNMVASCGEYQSEKEVISLIPDKIGDNANRLAAASSLVLYKEYLVDITMAGVTSRIAETSFEERSELEGIYDIGLKLSGGKVYKSSDNSNTLSSYTEKIGTYQINKDKDYLTVFRDTGNVQSYLIFTYTDNFDYEVKGLAPMFFSYKKVRFQETKTSMVEFEKTFFENKSTGGGSASYSLALLSYPNREKITKDVTYKIVGANPSASINGSTLSFTGTGTVNVEYTYGNFKGTDTISIINYQIKPALADAARTFAVGSTVPYNTIFSAVANFDNMGSFKSIEINNSQKAIAKNGNVEFIEAGTVEATLILRYVNTYKDGKDEVLELKQTIHLIIA